MTEADVIRIMREHLEGQFPKACSNCNRRFANLHEYIAITEHLGPAMPYDADMGEWQPTRPLGTVTYANCPCGGTMVLTSNGMPLLQLWSLLSWARTATQQRGMTPQQLLNYLRDEICKQVLAEPGPGET
jgi:hypothetical protein